MTATPLYLRESECSSFLDAIAKTSHSRETTVKKGEPLFRAQLGHEVRHVYEGDEKTGDVIGEYESIVPFEEKRLRPMADRAKEGRANSKGVPVFYSALDQKTAIAETRPWIGSYVSYGIFIAKRDLRMVNCSGNYMGSRNLSMTLKYSKNEPDSQTREKWVWHDIDEAFSEPITPSDDLADYVPTQILSELFRREQFNGIVFRSSIGPGKNIVLFQSDDVQFVRSRIVKIMKLELDYEESEMDGFY
jgi:hypothetical protein